MSTSVTKSEQVRSKQREFLFPCVLTYYKQPIVVERGQGTSIWDVEGNEYLDFFGGILTVSLGHCEPRVAEKVVQQIMTLQHVSTLYPTAQQVELAEQLAQMTPGSLQKSYFTNSGTEANETALLLAELFTGQTEVVVLRHAYAGRSMLAMNITGQSAWRLVPSKAASIKHLAAPYCYRCPFGLAYPSCKMRCATDLDELIRTTTRGKIAAFMAEPIFGVGGIITPPPEYFQIVVEIARKYGGVFICDEVQTGFGRTGDHWCAIEHWGVEPDIMTFAKGIGNGLPMGATIARPEIADAFTGMTISTFGGNPVSCAAALATIDVMHQENIPARAKKMGDTLKEALTKLAAEHACIGEVRGKGMMLGVELVEDRHSREPSPARALALMEAAKDARLLIGRGGLYGNVIRIAPPMLIEEDALQDGIARLGAAFKKIN